MFKKLFILFVIFFSVEVSAQCAMCKAVVEGGNETIAEGVNNGITYLMVFPYVLVALLFYLLIRYRRKAEN
ncbi:hypothetical protein WH52_03975 [Tenacibaculum holothuriorum]|uniref:Uncharacterized protein n=1 Tax=Tenacibaculum holothuriorum TaxID=1635173 RepID=A0A1Y2PEB2_9FLAO|nr:hypothetical protein WH52_03975 [Tenacibaculum holothuriorum]